MGRFVLPACPSSLRPFVEPNQTDLVMLNTASSSSEDRFDRMAATLFFFFACVTAVAVERAKLSGRLTPLKKRGSARYGARNRVRHSSIKTSVEFLSFRPRLCSSPIQASAKVYARKKTADGLAKKHSTIRTSFKKYKLRVYVSPPHDQSFQVQ